MPLHKAPPPPHLPEPHPEMRPDHELEDNPTMHPEHELPEHPTPLRFSGHRRGNPLLRAIIFGTFIAGMLWVILAVGNISINVILPVIAPVWVGSMTLMYNVFNR